MNKEQCILMALPGTIKHICNTCALPQATVSKMVSALIAEEKMFHAGWVKNGGGMASMVFARGPMPQGYTLPERPRSPRANPASVPRETKPKGISTPAAPHTLRQWDAENCTDHLFTKNTPDEPFRIPEPHPLMALYGIHTVTPNPVDEWVSYPIINASQPKPDNTK